MLVIIYCLAPFLWTLINAFKTPSEMFVLPIHYFPDKITTENFQNVFIKRPFAKFIFNSILIGICSTLLTIIIASIAAFKFRYMKLAQSLRWQRMILIFAMIPPTILLIPFFEIIRNLGLINNYLSLILSYFCLNLPFAIWMLSAAFREIPKELDEAAQIDGFSPAKILMRIIMPLSAPAIVATFILVFIFCWNEFLFALTMMPDEKHFTVPVGIALLSGASIYEMPWGEICAAVALTTFPVIVVIAIMQKWIVAGLTAGAVKG